MRYFLTFAIVSLLTAPITFAQISTMKKRVEKLPLFPAKKDSTAYYRVRSFIDSLKRYSETPLATWDSANRVFNDLHAKITGYRTEYFPGYHPVDSLAANVSSITHVSITGKKRIPRSLFEFKNIEVLELVNTRIKRLPGKLRKLPKLHTIEVYHNNGRLYLGQNHSVHDLIIRARSDREVPRSFRRFSGLERLDISESKLRKLPNGARKNRELKELTLKENNITLEQTIKPHPFVTKLALQHNQIQRIPASITQFPNLVRLSLNYNQITDIDTAIVNLKKLEALALYNNRLPRIPGALYHLTSLKVIDLFYNEIESLDSTLSDWKGLEILYLNNNKIVFLPKNMNELTSLEELFLAHNRIDRLPPSIGALKHLKILKLNHNFLQRLPDSLLSLEKMEDLDISNNYLTELSPSYFNYKAFKVFSLGNNPWSQQTKKLLAPKVAELRKRNVFVHVLGENESLD